MQTEESCEKLNSENISYRACKYSSLARCCIAVPSNYRFSSEHNAHLCLNTTTADRWTSGDSLSALSRPAIASDDDNRDK